MSDIASIRPIALLSAAAFVSAATMRVADPLIPQVAEEFLVTPGAAAIIVTAFAVAYGLCQLFYGPLGDRFGKYRLVALMTTVSAVTVAAPAFTGTLGTLGLARLLSGATAAALIPLAMAFIGDHVGYERRQAVLARFLSGQILGLLSGQIAGGIVGELLGWRAVFLLLGALYLGVAVLLWLELGSPRLPPPQLRGRLGVSRLIVSYLELARRPWARVVLVTVAVEGALFFGGFAFVGAHLRGAFGLDYTTVGLLLGGLGIGGLAYALVVRLLVARLGERGLALGGGIVLMVGFLAIAAAHRPLLVLPGTFLVGLGFYMLHNTLQTNATQMWPEMRGLAVSSFASCFFLGQAGGVWLCGRLGDRLGFPAVFILVGLALLAVGVVFGRLIATRPRAGGEGAAAVAEPRARPARR
ncbi:MAG TPA: MFS transporter [Geminicoccaceae bacterium]|nr:MFS transporter [Geminicoccaceae bacterium]